MDVLERARALAATTVLGEVAAPTLIALAERATVREAAAGTTVSCRRPDGAVVVVVARGGLAQGGRPLAAGQILGAAAALDAAAPAAEAQAEDDAIVLELGVDDFVDVLAEHPAAARALARDLARALRQAARR